MKCKKCGEQIEAGMMNCPNCGEYVDRMNHPLCIWGFIVALGSTLYNRFEITAVVAIILCIIGLRKIKGTRYIGKGLAIAGICIGSLNFIYYIAAQIIDEYLATLITSTSCALWNNIF